MIKKFHDLTVDELYDIYKLRTDVFVVEQQCAYPEITEADKYSVHMWLSGEEGIRAYLRVVPKGLVFDEVSLGRVVSAQRGRDYGRRIFSEGIRYAYHEMGARRLKIMAQVQARGFYEKFGFRQISEPFLDDGILHINMLWKAPEPDTENAAVRGRGKQAAMKKDSRDGCGEEPSRSERSVTMKIERKEHMRGGEGHVILKYLLEDEQLNGKCRMYAEATLEPGCSIGYHEHHGDSETYYILRGTGTYSDNGTPRTVKPGDVTFTPDGSGHSMRNDGNTDLVFMALILPS